MFFFLSRCSSHLKQKLLSPAAVAGELRIGGQEHFYMETQSMLVVPVGEETEFNAYVSTQFPTLMQVLP